MPRIKDNLTGEVFEVDESQLSKFGLSAPQPQSPLTSTPSGQTTPDISQMLPSLQPTQPQTGFGALLNQQPATQPTDEINVMKTIFQKAWKQAATIKEQQTIADNWKNAFGNELFGTDKKKPEATKLRKEFSAETKTSNFRLAQDAYNRIKEAPNTGAGDLSLIYAYIKALDPTSVVREGEINISKATGSVPENLLTAYKRVKEGKLLSDQQRAEYRGEIARFYNEKIREQQQRNAFYSGLATDMGLDPNEVTGEYKDIQSVEIPELPKETQQQTLQGPAGLLYDFLLKEPVEGVQESVRRQKEAPPTQSLGEVLNPVNVGGRFYKEIIEPQAGPAFNTVAKLQLLKGLLGLGKGLVSGGQKLLTTPKIAIAQRSATVADAVKQGLTVSGDDLIKTVTNFKKNISATDIKQYDKFLETANSLYKGKQIPIDQAVGILDQANTAFTKAGALKTSAAAAYDATVSRWLNKNLPSTVEQAQRSLAGAKGRESFLKKLIFPTAIGAGVGTGIGIGVGSLSRMLGISGRQ